MNVLRRIGRALGKKTTAALLGVALQFLPISSEAKERLTEVCMAFLVGQGVADLGKERVKEERRSSVPTVGR